MVRRASTTTDSKQPGPSVSADFKDLEPFAPIHSHEVLDLESHTDYWEPSSVNEPPLSNGSCPPGSPTMTLDRSASNHPILTRNDSERNPSRRSPSRFDSLHWKYAKFAFLCTIVLFITWVRSGTSCSKHQLSSGRSSSCVNYWAILTLFCYRSLFP